MRSKFIDSLPKAKNYAFLLLKFRLRSQKEIYARLKKKGFAEETINETISFLKEKDFINDDYFTKAWIDARVKKPLGIRRLRQELSLKGIPKEIIDKQIQDLKKNYSEEEIVLKLAKNKFSRLKNIDSQKVKRRIYTYLLSRGFTPEIVIDAVNQL